MKGKGSVKSNKNELQKALDAIQNIPVLVVGDVILDRYVWGSVERISPEAPVPIVDVQRMEARLGGAGNVGRNLIAIGAKACLCGFVGADEGGQTVLALLEKEGIDRSGIIQDRDRPTSVKTRVIAQGQQMVRIDHEKRGVPGVGLREGFAAVVEAHLEAHRAVIVSDYGKGAISEALFKKFTEARHNGRIGIGIRPLVVDPHPTNYEIYDEICVAKPNRKEASIASGVKIVDRATAIQAAQVLIKKWKASMMMVTLGEDGLVLAFADGREPVCLDTVALEVFDVSGAGDTVTAIFTAALAAGVEPAIAGDLANLGAGIVVSEVGTVAVSNQQLRERIALME